VLASAGGIRRPGRGLSLQRGGDRRGRLGLTGIGFSLHSDIVAPYILHYGSEALKHKYLPKLVSGELVTAIAMTEPGAGSDLQGSRPPRCWTATST
jgi:alkylation response protein AidB-like acyl-CoA dehydrogenase